MNRIIKIIDEYIDDSVGKVQPINGGSINEAFKVVTDNHHYFLKLNEEIEFDNFFYVEAKSLELLSETDTFRIPEVIKFGKEFLILEFIKNGAHEHGFWLKMARSLAKLHEYSADYFGLEFDNFIGSLEQKNTPSQSWSEFFATQRILPLVRMAYDQGKFDGNILIKSESFCNRLDEIFPEEKPALVHGDLWNGNFMCSSEGEPVVFDPAIHFGHREMDISMTKLFGGFDESFYHHYHAFNPLEKGWEQRIKYCHAYPLLVHAVLFGGNYIKGVEGSLMEF